MLVVGGGGNADLYFLVRNPDAEFSGWAAEISAAGYVGPDVAFGSRTTLTPDRVFIGEPGYSFQFQNAGPRQLPASP